MKFIFVLFLIVSLIFVGAGTYLFYQVKNSTGELSFDSVKTYCLSSLKSSFSKGEKQELKSEANKVKDRAYLEATEHNPEGDILPDQIDDNVKKKIKEEINAN